MTGSFVKFGYLLAAAACASATHASVAGAAAGHDGSAGGAGGGVAHVDDVLHGVGDVVDASVFEGRDRGAEAAAGAQVFRYGRRWLRGDSLLGWSGGVVVVRPESTSRSSRFQPPRGKAPRRGPRF